MKKFILGSLMAVTMLMPVAAMASTPFTPAQIDAVIGLLVAFGVDQAVIDEVYLDLIEGGTN